MGKTIHFVTGNKGKFAEVTNFITTLNNENIGRIITIKQSPLELLEPQSLDILEISRFKAKYAWDILKLPLIVDDGGIYFTAYNQFPGALAKYVNYGIGIKGMLKLLEDDPKAEFRSVITYTKDGENFHSFEGICPGSVIIPDDIAHIDPDLPYTGLFHPDGQNGSLESLKKQGPIGDFHHRFQAVKKFCQWYGDND